MSTLIPLYGVEGKRPSVKRCLFGRPNRENLENAFNEQENKLNADIEIAAKKFSEVWGLNPITGQKVDNAQHIVTSFDVTDYVPSFYLKGYSRRKTKSCVSRSRSQSPMNITDFLSRPVARPSCKRRLPLDLQSDITVNDENKNDLMDMSRIQVPIAATVTTPSSSAESSPMTDSYPSSPMSLQEIAHQTPGVKTQQTQMQDFFPLHKRPRTKQQET